MTTELSKTILSRLACPVCHSELDFTDEPSCTSCGRTYSQTPDDQYDFRISEELTHEVSVTLRPDDTVPDSVVGLPRGTNPVPPDESLPKHLSPALASHFLDPKEDAVVLDFGCGNGQLRDFCTQRGFEWCGFDINSTEATVVGDGHFLPFAERSFEVIVTTAVFEHVDNPFVVASELHRVLEPGGILIGSVAFLEPFHGASRFHASHYGIYTALTEAGLGVKHLAPYNIVKPLWNTNWEAPVTLSRRLFPGLPFRLRTALVMPLHLISIMYYQLGAIVASDRPYNAVSTDRRLSLAGQIAFVASK